MGEEEKPYKEKLENIYKDDLFAPPTGRKSFQIISICLAELFGSFFVMMLGCTSWFSVIPGIGVMYNPNPSLLEFALAWGLAYGGIYVCMAHISGHFLNPALTVVMVILGEMSIYRMLLYIVSQIVGCLSGMLLLKATNPDVSGDFCLAKPTKGLPLMNAFVYELWGTFLLSTLFCICHDSRTRTSFDFSPVKFGISLIALHLALYKFTGCSLNPARSISAAVVANDFQHVWIYIAGPFLGAIIAPLFYLLVFNSSIVEPGGEAAPEAAAA